MKAQAITTYILIGLGCTACATDDSATASQPTEPPVSDDSGDAREVEIKTHQYSVRLRAGDSLWFVNEHGDLRIRGSGDGGVHYAAVIQKLDGEQRDVQFGTDRRAGGLEFSVRPPADWIGRVDASARVPPDSAIDLETRDGLIEVRAGDANVIARSAGGPIKYRGGGSIDVTSATGEVQLSLSALDYAGDAGHVATGGSVQLWLTPGANLAVNFVAGGDIVNNLPGSIAEQTQSADGAMTLRLGRGDAELSIQAGGDIVIGAVPVR